MAEEVKFTEDEMKQINTLQQGYVNLQSALGQLSVNRIRLNQQFDDLDTAEDNVRVQFVENQTKERDFVDGINKKYGDGNLDLSTGVFTPKPVEKTVEKTDKTL
jgi:mannitol/fructose-specific phosphotransferase system IIA component